MQGTNKAISLLIFYKGFLPYFIGVTLSFNILSSCKKKQPASVSCYFFLNAVISLLVFFQMDITLRTSSVGNSILEIEVLSFRYEDAIPRPHCFESISREPASVKLSVLRKTPSLIWDYLYDFCEARSCDRVFVP